LEERRFLEGLGVAVAPYLAIDQAGDVKAWDFSTSRAVLKTRRLGYDGKGQALAASAPEAAQAFDRLGAAPSILEAFMPFRCEASAIVARGAGGAMAAFEPAQNEHRDHILAVSRVPSGLQPATIASAIATAEKIATALDHTGVLAVEYFVIDGPGGEALVVNEIAPRVHNSGHWTQDGANISQFTQHIRAIAGWPLVAPQTLGRTRMVNLIGEDATHWRQLAGEAGARLHLYGKRDIRPGRKMGHVNYVSFGLHKNGGG
ncbi:MAG: ATP-grasp domain-containing protein, partial [Rhizobiales bacterium]|nr:ATP-grasp domain-containing protein [Hyphomicrobiales bacterium]